MADEYVSVNFEFNVVYWPKLFLIVCFVFFHQKRRWRSWKYDVYPHWYVVQSIFTDRFEGIVCQIFRLFFWVPYILAHITSCLWCHIFPYILSVRLPSRVHGKRPGPRKWLAGYIRGNTSDSKGEECKQRLCYNISLTSKILKSNNNYYHLIFKLNCHCLVLLLSSREDLILVKALTVI